MHRPLVYMSKDQVLGLVPKSDDEFLRYINSIIFKQKSIKMHRVFWSCMMPTQVRCIILSAFVYLFEFKNKNKMF